ncbi:MAG: RagB/SusD family nutrient uptake outer membrane protein [Bacteroidota bacterium]
MKKNFFIAAVALVAMAIVSTSCRKVEREPKDWFGSSLVFDSLDQNAIVAAFNLNDIYNYIPGGFNRINNFAGTGDYLDAASGDAIPSRNNAPVSYYYTGAINVLNNPDPYWANSYYGIRRANIFIGNIDVVPTAALTKRYWKAEARFIRSLLYFELVKRYGGVPLIGNKVFSLEDDLQIPRNTFAECVDYIVSECNAVKDSLRPEPISDADWGRIPRGAAVALKCRVLLYAASPLFNGGGFETDATKKALTGYPTADPSRWQKVIDAAEELKALNYYALQTSLTATFLTKKNTEVILSKQNANSFSLESTQAPVGYAGTTASQGLTSPTQELVNAFPMLNGLSITEAGSGYSAANPYAGRDPRLAATVFMNGTSTGGTRWLNRPVETFEGGKDKPNTAATATQTKTGYYVRKFLGDFTNSTAYSNQSHTFVIFRYSEVLLNYAEALNEMGRVEDAVMQDTLIRRRAGLTPGTNRRYGIKAGISQAEMRDLIRNERRIELAFEEQRFWDVRRWKIAPTVLNGPLTGVKITNGTPLTYQAVTVATMVFTNKLYHMPIPYDEITKNLKLIQNEGW